MSRVRWLASGLLVCSLVACRRAAPLEVQVLECYSPEEREQLLVLQETLQQLYQAFCFEPGAEADWEAQRALFCEGASFLAPVGPGAVAKATGSEQFLEDFQAWVRSERMRATGFHERISHTRIDLFGNIAHAFVAFEGSVPPAGIQAAGGDAAAALLRTRGLDSVQLVCVAGRWKVAAFSTQFAPRGAALPGRFER